MGLSTTSSKPTFHAGQDGPKQFSATNKFPASIPQKKKKKQSQLPSGASSSKKNCRMHHMTAKQCRPPPHLKRHTQCRSYKTRVHDLEEKEYMTTWRGATHAARQKNIDRTGASMDATGGGVRVSDRQTGSRNPAAAQGGPSPHQLHAAELIPASSNQLDGADEGRITSSWTLLHP